jgi:hypothetical protein
VVVEIGGVVADGGAVPASTVVVVDELVVGTVGAMSTTLWQWRAPLGV